MHKRFFIRIVAVVLCLICAAGLSAPAFAADLGYQYEFEQEFTFSNFVQHTNSNWYVVDFAFDPVSAEGDYVEFSIDDYIYTAKFHMEQRTYEYHYIGNAYELMGFGDQNDLPYLLVISPDDPGMNLLYLRSDLFGKLFQGDREKIHVTMSVAYSNMEVGDVASVFTIVGQKLLSLFDTIISLFWSSSGSGVGSPTFLGVMSLIALGISLALLLIKVVLNFLHLRG